MWNTIFGIAWSVFSLAITFGGYPHQILVDRRAKKSSISPFLVATVWASTLMSLLYGVTKPDHFIALMQTPALILVTVIGLQAIVYRRRPGQASADAESPLKKERK
jgi:putative effector of murein hydrolase